MQVYRGLDIGTAKPTAAERAAVPHHLIDVAEPDEEWSVARFQARGARRGRRHRGARQARAARRRHRPLRAGGRRPARRSRPRTARVRAELEPRRRRRRPRAPTPSSSGSIPSRRPRIEPGNARRIVRALEVIEITGRPFSSFGAGLADVRRHRVPGRDRRRVAARVPCSPAHRARGSRPCATPGLVDEVAALAGPRRAVAHRRARRSATRRCSPTSTGDEPSLDAALDAAVAPHPAVRPPPAHVVPAGPAHHLARRRRRIRARCCRPSWQAGAHDRRPPREAARHRQRLPRVVVARRAARMLGGHGAGDRAVRPPPRHRRRRADRAEPGHRRRRLPRCCSSTPTAASPR